VSTPALDILQPGPVFLGYCHKRCPPRPAWVTDPRVVEIASFTGCNLERPGENWVERWDFNAAGFYNTPEAAAASLAASRDTGDFRLFAYNFYPLRFDSFGNAVLVDAAKVFGVSIADIPPRGSDGVNFLGYDAVERWAERSPGHADDRALGGGFGCSPLFCNLLAPEHPTNRYCLLSEWDDAVRAARAFAIDQPEPGCYYIFGVFELPRRL
jgi:hypothetical protein